MRVKVIAVMNKHIKKYTSLIRAGMLDMLQWRVHVFITLIGNLIYLIIIYNLWQAIYASSPQDTVNGMTFTDTMIYLVLAAAIFNVLSLWIVWEMGNEIQSGGMILNLIRPLEYRSHQLFSCMGANVMNLFMMFIPTFVVVSIVTGGAIPLGLNLVYFLIALFLGLLINFHIDFFVGTICIYTESTWGVDAAKNIIVMLLSGAVIPLAFFPENFRNIVQFMPFQAIYNIPLRILTGHVTGIKEILTLFGVQLFWVAVMYIASGLFWKQSIKKITINGG
jgi:ABC-2 type transport system permease protein